MLWLYQCGSVWRYLIISHPCGKDGAPVAGMYRCASACLGPLSMLICACALMNCDFGADVQYDKTH